MTILEALIQLRDDIKLWVTNNLKAKVSTSTTINGKELKSNITLTAADVGADASGSATAALTSANEYTDEAISNLVDNMDGVLLSIPTTGWSNVSPYTITIEVNGVKANQHPMFYLIPSGDEATEEELNAVNLITDIATEENSVIITASAIPSFGFSIALYGLSNNVEYAPADYASLAGRVAVNEANLSKFGVDAIIIVDELPEDAAFNSNTLYLIPANTTN
jgi:hypothetical protein